LKFLFARESQRASPRANSTATWESHELWSEDPVMEPYKVAGRLGQAPGQAMDDGGIPDRKSNDRCVAPATTDEFSAGLKTVSQ